MLTEQEQYNLTVTNTPGFNARIEDLMRLNGVDNLIREKMSSHEGLFPTSYRRECNVYISSSDSRFSEFE